MHITEHKTLNKGHFILIKQETNYYENGNTLNKQRRENIITMFENNQFTLNYPWSLLSDNINLAQKFNCSMSVHI